MCYKGSDFISMEKEKCVIFEKIVNINVINASGLVFMKT